MPKALKKSPNLWVLALAAVAGSLMFAPPVKSQPQILTSGLPGQETYFNYDALASYYATRNMNPIWVRGTGSFQPRVDAMLKIFEESWTHGLNPAHYNIEKISSLLKNVNAQNQLELDLLVSDSFIRYARDLTGMRGDRQSADQKLSYWREPMSEAEILQLVGDKPDPIESVRALEPNYALYQSLRAELIRLAAMPEQQGKAVTAKTLLKPGKSYKEIPAIRQKMEMAITEGANVELYDEALATRIISLQKDYGLETDGVIGPKTLELVNITSDDKIKQIVANMERLRWIGSARPDRYILVNIPSANLWAVDGGEVKLEMPVIVGKTARPTYSFKTEITGVRLNPNWTVPPTIKQKDFLPLLQQDPSALTKKGIELVANGYTVDPTTVDWNNISSRGLHSFKMVQSPGDDNPLGKVRVIMENPYNIYLHDTNHREMFSKQERNLSSGCIRVSKPEELADFILNHNAGWRTENLPKMINSGRMRDVKTDQPIPVYITYQTVWLNTDGRLVYGRDVYGQDRELVNILERKDAVHIPRPSSQKDISL